MRVAVVGHVEWCEFAQVPHVPTPGEIVHADADFEEPGGGGAVAAVQLMKLAGERHPVHRLRRRRDRPPLAARGSRSSGSTCEGGFRPEPQRRAFVHVDDRGERTITVLGPRLGPRGADALAWDELDDTDAVYLTAGDADAVRHARRARVLVATPRGLDTLAEAHVELDALVSSGRDPGELYREGDLDPVPKVVVRTLGATGRRVGDRLRRARQVGSRAAARAGPRRLRRRRQLRRRPHLRARRRLGDRQGGGAGGPLRRGLHDRQRPLRGPAATLVSQATRPSSGSIGQAVGHPRLQAAVEVVRVVAGGREGLRGQRRPAARAAVEDDRPVAVDRVAPPR